MPEQWSGLVSIVTVAVIVLLVLWPVVARLWNRIRRVDGWLSEMRRKDPQAAPPGRGTERIANRTDAAGAVSSNASNNVGA